MRNPLADLVAAAPQLAASLAWPGASAEEAAVVSGLLASVSTWARRDLDAAAIDEAHAIPDAVYASAAELGLFGLSIPEAYDGAGLSMPAVAQVIEALARHDRSVATAVGLHNGLGLHGLISLGTEAQKARWLPGLASGKELSAFSATEPEAGSHIAGVKSTAVADGDGLRLSGSKIFVTNGGRASMFTILARTPGLGGARKGHSVLLLTRGMEGFSVGAEERKLGLRGTSTTTLSFDDVPVPLDRVLGTPGKGLDHLASILAWGRTLMAAGSLGSARAARDLALAHVVTRRQFGKALATFGQVRAHVAGIEARIRALEAAVALTTRLAGGTGDLGWASAATKILASEGAWQVADTALQLHGGSGYIEDTGVARILRDARITRIFEGANEVLRLHVATGILATGADAPRLEEKVPAPLAELARRFDALRARLADAVATLKARHGIRLPGEQIPLAAVADATIGLFALLAVILRAAAPNRGAPDEVDAYTASVLALEVELALDRLGRDDLAEAVGRVSDGAYRAADASGFDTPSS